MTRTSAIVKLTLATCTSLLGRPSAAAVRRAWAIAAGLALAASTTLWAGRPGERGPDPAYDSPAAVSFTHTTPPYWGHQRFITYTVGAWPSRPTDGAVGNILAPSATAAAPSGRDVSSPTSSTGNVAVETWLRTAAAPKYRSAALINATVLVAR